MNKTWRAAPIGAPCADTFGALLGEERRMISERTKAGLAAARRGARQCRAGHWQSRGRGRAHRGFASDIRRNGRLVGPEGCRAIERARDRYAAGGKWRAQTVIRVRERLRP